MAAAAPESQPIILSPHSLYQLKTPCTAKYLVGELNKSAADAEIETLQVAFRVLKGKAKKKDPDPEKITAYNNVCTIIGIHTDSTTEEEKKSILKGTIENEAAAIAAFVKKHFNAIPRPAEFNSLYSNLEACSIQGTFKKQQVALPSQSGPKVVGWELFRRCNKTFPQTGSLRLLGEESTNIQYDSLLIGRVTVNMPSGAAVTAEKVSTFVIAEGLLAHTHLMKFTSKMPKDVAMRLLTKVTYEAKRSLLIGEHSSATTYTHKTDEQYSAVLNHTSKVKGTIDHDDAPKCFKGTELTVSLRHLRIHHAKSLSNFEEIIVFIAKMIFSIEADPESKPKDYPIKNEMAFLDYLREVDIKESKEKLIQDVHAEIQALFQGGNIASPQDPYFIHPKYKSLSTKRNLFFQQEKGKKWEQVFNGEQENIGYFTIKDIRDFGTEEFKAALKSDPSKIRFKYKNEAPAPATDEGDEGEKKVDFKNPLEFIKFISGSFTFDEKHYVVLDGKFYESSTTFKDHLERFFRTSLCHMYIDKPHPFALETVWKMNGSKALSEGEYNVSCRTKDIKKTTKNALLTLDTIIVESVEICDILRVPKGDENLVLYAVKIGLAGDTRIVCAQVMGALSLIYGARETLETEIKKLEGVWSGSTENKIEKSKKIMQKSDNALVKYFSQIVNYSGDVEVRLNAQKDFLQLYGYNPLAFLRLFQRPITFVIAFVDKTKNPMDLAKEKETELPSGYTSKITSEAARLAISNIRKEVSRLGATVKIQQIEFDHSAQAATEGAGRSSPAHTGAGGLTPQEIAALPAHSGAAIGGFKRPQEEAPPQESHAKRRATVQTNIMSYYGK